MTYVSVVYCFTLVALDVQECGITDTGAEALLEALRLNATLLILDIRGNHLVNHQLLDRIVQQVLINADGKPTTVSVPLHTKHFHTRPSQCAAFHA